MKRILLIVLSILLMCPGMAGAEMPLVYPAETVISVVPLTRVQSALVSWLYGPVLEGQARIELPEGTRYDDVAPAMKVLMLDYPELFHLDRSYTVSYYQDEPETAIAVTPEYRMDAAHAEKVRAQMYASALEMIWQDRTALGLHDALVARVHYGGETEMRHTAAAALLTGEATCEGYAQALSLVYRMAGIRWGMISGTAVNGEGRTENHAWNIAWLGGCTLIDATWNDQERSGYNTHWYFGLSGEQMAADHAVDSDLLVPLCGDQAGWHRQNGAVALTSGQVMQAVQRLAVEGTAVNLRIPDAALYQWITSDIGVLLDEYNTICPEGCGFYGSYVYLTCDTQQCLIIDRAETAQ